MRHLIPIVVLFASAVAVFADGIGDTMLQPIDVFQLEYADDPQISPDGTRVVYVRTAMDIMTDRRVSTLWAIDSDGGDHRPLVTGGDRLRSPRWSPDGSRLLYLSGEEHTAQVYCRWMDTGVTARLAQLPGPASGIAWSPDGRRVAFAMPVENQAKPFVELPPRPRGATWADPPKVIDGVIYRIDGVGYTSDMFFQLFVLPADGGSPRQITSGDFHHRDPVWTPDGEALVFSANRHDDWEYQPRNTEIYRVDVGTREITALTDREGPDTEPAVSPDGRTIAYLGFDDRYQGYQVTRLYVMDADGGGVRLLTGDLDRSVERPVWSADGDGIYVQYDDEGNTKLALVTLDGEVRVLAGDVGGLSLGRPYSGGAYSVGRDGGFAFTETRPDHPADVAFGRPGGEVRRLTRLNDDLLGSKELARVEEIRFPSSFDGRTIQGWLVTPPGFDPSRTYPMILEIHGGPFADYGDRFSAEIQLYAAAGYVVLYLNPRGSTSYGEEFGNLIHHAYPGRDFDDLMSGVDAVLARGFVDPANLFVTGGSGGGVLTAWTVGMTDRFAAAVVAKPVINWTSFALTADFYPMFYRYWFPGPPWEFAEHYWKRSPLSLVGNVTTPTMLLTGEDDHRTPISESEQYYQALKIRRVETVLVRMPGASHSIARRPSQLIAKVASILKWFDMHRDDGE